MQPKDMWPEKMAFGFCERYLELNYLSVVTRMNGVPK